MTQVVDAGIDTWSVAWRIPADSPVLRELVEAATVPSVRSRLMPDPIGGHRVGWFPAARLMFAEGHPLAGGLAGGDVLDDSLGSLRSSLSEVGLDPELVQCRGVGGCLEGVAMLRRLDSTVDLRFDNVSEGLAVLAGVAALPLPRLKTSIYREVGGRRVETVEFRGYRGRNIVGRWYDKGVESRSADRGSWVRPEDQRRFSSQGRPMLEGLGSSSFVRDSFVRRFEPLWKASKGVRVGSAMQLACRLLELQESGAITPGQAKAVAGHLVLETARAHKQSRAQVFKDRARAREHGLVLADGVLDEVDVDLGEVMEQVFDAGVWGEG